MGLFGNSEEKAAAQAESERLRALPVAELAAEVMPAFGPDGIGAKSGHRQGPMEATEWLMASTSTKVKYRQPILGPTIEALEALNQAGLLERRSFGGGSTYHATRLGETALAEGTVRRQLSAGA